ncbi:hypothetical protein CASFOL_031726 [Castilleja foliolosa]|uniref:Uncharacterized protein n=1 Tax=Castilleja foliolosa TaxID=1961234 RepID=A0ABD3C5I8_9LAMI
MEDWVTLLDGLGAMVEVSALSKRRASTNDGGEMMKKNNRYSILELAREDDGARSEGEADYKRNPNFGMGAASQLRTHNLRKVENPKPLLMDLLHLNWRGQPMAITKSHLQKPVGGWSFGGEAAQR